MTQLKICSFNVRGINENKKRRDIFTYLRRRKYDICMLQESHCTKDQEKIWENEWGYKAYFSSFKGNSRGVVILFNNTFQYTLHSISTDKEGRFVFIDCTINGVKLSIANLYAPNEDEPVFFEIIQNKLEKLDSNNIILGGDFNVVQDYLLDTLNLQNRNNSQAHQKVLELKNDLDLIDPWRNMNPDTKMFTWHNSQNKQSRLDYFLISSTILQNVEKAVIKPGYRSDHSIVEVTFNFNSQERGRGVWKFNNSLLRDETYTQKIKKHIADTKDQYRAINMNLPDDDPLNFTINSQLLLDVIKLEIRGKTIAYSSAVKRCNQKAEMELENKIDRLHEQYTEIPSIENLNNLNEANNNLKLLREKKIEGIIMRSKAKWHLEGEKNSRYFCNLEKRHYQEKCISKLIGEDGTEKTIMSDILEEEANFYQNLYTSKKPVLNSEDKRIFFDNNNHFYTLSNEDSLKLETQITIEECYKVLKDMKLNKSPGSDGFTPEFYLYFWNDIKHVMINSFKESFKNGKLSDSQKLGIITCLPKTGKDKLFIKNWRPISLLNIDYKILSGVIANRMKTYLDPLISKCQKGFVSGRYIGECTRLVSDLIHHLMKTNKPGIILMIDFEKAFDSLEWGFLEHVLKYFNFGKYIIQWIKCFYTDIESFVINNGHMSKRFPLSRGVRQGDPLSPYLFILCAEILARSIVNSNEIRGLKIDDSEFLLSQLADDTTLFLEPEEESFCACMNLLERFSNISGLKINFTKTLAVKINLPNNLIYTIGNSNLIKWQNNGTFNLLGIKYNLDTENFLDLNFENKAQEFENALNIWNTRNLTIYGKNCVIKSLALSKLVHLFSAIPNPPDSFFTRLQKACFNFIWSGKGERIKRTTMYNSYENGGFKITNIKHFCAAQKVTWIKRLLNDQLTAEWKTLFLSTIERFGGNIIWLSNELKPVFFKHLNPFWKDVYQAWSSIREDNIPTQKECLFHNKYIQINKKSVYFHDWYINGVSHINDIIDEQGNFFTWDRFSQTFNIQNQSFKYISFLHSIPKTWKKRLKDSAQKLTNLDIRKVIKIKHLKKSSNYFYNELMDAIVTKPVKSQEKWNNSLSEDIAEEEWKKLYILPAKLTIDTKLRTFQMKILHDILPLNNWLFKCNLKETPKCTFCNLQNETIEHLFWECIHSKNIWFKLIDWLKNFFPEEHQNIFNKKGILLGNDKGDFSIEHIKLITKRFIYKSKLDNNIPNFTNLLSQIKFTIQITNLYHPKLKRKWNVNVVNYFS